MNVDDMDRDQLISYIKELQDSLQKEKVGRSQDEADFSALVREYEKEIDQKNREILKLKGKVISLDIGLTSYKDKIGVPIITEGEEKDLYYGEQRDLILSILSQSINGLSKYSRRYHILTSILTSNCPKGERYKKLEGIKSVFSNYNGLSTTLISKLRNLGIIVRDDFKGHPILLLDTDTDGRYPVSISSTPSDGRSGSNIVSEFIRLLF